MKRNACGRTLTALSFTTLGSEPTKAAQVHRASPIAKKSAVADRDPDSLRGGGLDLRRLLVHHLLLASLLVSMPHGRGPEAARRDAGLDGAGRELDRAKGVGRTRHSARASEIALSPDESTLIVADEESRGVFLLPRSLSEPQKVPRGRVARARPRRSSRSGDRVYVHGAKPCPPTQHAAPRDVIRAPSPGREGQRSPPRRPWYRPSPSAARERRLSARPSRESRPSTQSGQGPLRRATPRPHRSTRASCEPARAACSWRCDGRSGGPGRSRRTVLAPTPGVSSPRTKNKPWSRAPGLPRSAWSN